jgi:GTPase SAR1 family protein
MAGKSSLLRSLVDHTSDKRLTSEAERTIGLDIQPVVLADPQDRTPSGIEFQVYDAGGHNEYQVKCAILRHQCLSAQY